MEVYESPAGMYQYELLPAFANFILEHHVDEFAELQYQHSHKVNLPLLQFLARFSKEELLAISKESLKELLSMLAQNKAKEQIELSLGRWVQNQLQVIQSFEVIVEDITVLNHIRNEAFKAFIPAYTNDIKTALQLTSEIDSFLVGSTTSSMRIYIDMLKERISKKEEQLLEAQSIAHIGSYDWDIVNNTTIDSPELRRIFEMESKGLEPWMNRVHPEDIGKVTAALETAYKTGNYECEFRYNAADSVKEIWARGLVTTEGGKPVRMIGTVQDITDRKAIEDTLLLKTIELERSNEDLQQFASIASHDLKEPLRKISMFSEMIAASEGATLSAGAQKNLNKIGDATLRMGTLIDDILSYSSLNHQEQPQTISLQRLAAEVTDFLEHTIREKAAIIEFESLNDAYVIPFQFRQLFQNLIVNSLKFSKPDVSPHISISTKKVPVSKVEAEGVKPANSYLQIVFRDNGIGFSQEDADKIFGLFNRLHSKKQYEGTGLGLSICRKVVENHGGTIQAISAPGDGAAFHILIPQ